MAQLISNSVITAGRLTVHSPPTHTEGVRRLKRARTTEESLEKAVSASLWLGLSNTCYLRMKESLWAASEPAALAFIIPHN